MRDKLTKRRIKVDYESMIIYLHLDADFVRYIFKNSSKISSRRLALAFLRSKKVDIESVYFEMKDKGLLPDNNRSQFYIFDDKEVDESALDGALAAAIDNTPDFFRGY